MTNDEIFLNEAHIAEFGKFMKAIIPAAGYATRLYPLTENMPKALLPVGGRPMLSRIVDKINEITEVDEIVIVSNDRFASHFTKWAQTAMTDKNIHVINDGTKSDNDRLGTIGDIALAVQAKNINENLLIVGGDNLFEFSITDFVDFARKNNSSALAVFDIKNLPLASQFGVVTLDTSQKIVNFIEKPTQPRSSLVATLCYFLKKEDVALIGQYLKEGNKPDRAGDFIAWLHKKSPVYGFSFSGNWFDIGTPEQYENVCKLF
ncbi:MAG: nucleotidyltransferase family protein [Candidatus Aenigmarchaeota archaeon]|nr:nucleotidyltransferase family protein [Candidatus Aenigmarchaeota archaeon]